MPISENPQAETAEPHPGTTILGLGRVRLGAVIALAVAAGFVGWLLLTGDDDGKPAPKKTIEFVSLAELRALPASVGHPVYWAGPKRGVKYELTRAPDGVYIRYLPADASLNDTRPNFLTVGTYPYPNAYATARKQASTSSVFKRRIAGHGIAYSLPGNRGSVYFAYPRLDYLHEVYDPSPRRAQRLVLSGRVRPID